MAPPLKFGIGQPVRRREDPRFLTGLGTYTDDINLPNQAFAQVLRSPYPHAEIRAADTNAAKAAPGVLAVLTGADVEADGIGDMPCMSKAFDPTGEMRDYVLGPGAKIPSRPVLAKGRVRYVGDAVALVIAEALDQARDAAELIEVSYEPLPAVGGAADAMDDGAPRIWENWPSNIAFEWHNGDREAVDAALKAAARVVVVDLVNNRVNANPIEPRAALGDYNAEGQCFTLYVGCQSPHILRSLLAGDIFRVATERVNVISRDVGGGFGMKYTLYPEYALTLWASRRVGRPVKWTSDRSEAFVSDAHGRDHVTRMHLGLDAEGRFLGMRAEVTANMGAYYSNLGPAIPTVEGEHIQTTVYTTPAVYTRVRGVFTNTVPVDAYRGAGRPELNYRAERLIDVAARELGLDPGRLRERNFVPAAAMPFTNASGATFDSGDFAGNAKQARTAAAWDDIEARRREARGRGKLRGIGMSYYIDECAGPLLGGEEAVIRFEDDDTVSAFVGGNATGQGHETAFAQILSEALGVPFESVNLRQADLEHITETIGQGGSRTVLVCGTAISRAADDAIAKGKDLAADLLEVAAQDLEYGEGRYTIVGSDRSVTLFEVAAAYRAEAREGPGALTGAGEFTPGEANFPNGCHVCEVEVDRDTGAVEIVDYVVVDDFGRVINPLLLAGQIHGGIAQGAGQALWEHAVYDGAGQLLSASFMDYCMPRASDLPMLDTSWREILCRTNALGMKGAGEAGTIGAPAAVINAVVDSLAEFGVTHIDMPATPERVWRAITGAPGRRSVPG